MLLRSKLLMPSLAVSSSPVRQAQGRLWRGSIHLVLALVLLLLLACGDDTTTEVVSQSGQNHIEIVAEESDLPECTEDNEGEQVLVKGENTARTCIDDEWTAAFTPGRDTVYLKSKDISCYTTELADKQGVKVICDGDSVGVLLNGGAGAKGDKGDAGAGCSLVQLDSVTVRLFCGADSTSIYLGEKPKAVVDTTKDPEQVPITVDSLTGFAQKGPFLKGGKVTLYELYDGYTLEKTGKTYSCEILNDSGYYKFPKMELSSQYVLIHANGYYQELSTGAKSMEPIEMNVLVDLLERKTANINLFTHLEAGRVKNLVQHKQLNVQPAKARAKKEVLDIFHIDTTGFNTPFEGLNVLGETDAEASLLAMSILLQNMSDKTIPELIAGMADDVAKNGAWTDFLYKAKVAEETIFPDFMGAYAFYRSNMIERGLSAKVPYFEKYLRYFWNIELGLGVCGSDSVPQNAVKHVSNRYSRYYARTYSDTASAGGKNRFLCMDADSTKWRFAMDIEKDTMGTAFKNNKTGVTVVGAISRHQLLWDSDEVRYADSLEEDVSWGCISELQNRCVGKTDEKRRKCKDDGMSGKECFIDARDSNIYEYVKIGTQVWMAENLRYADSVKTPSLKGKTLCYDNIAKNCDELGMLYYWSAAIDSVRLFINHQDCGYRYACTLPDKWQGICPNGWHLPTLQEQEILVDAVGGDSVAGEKLKSRYGWYGNGNGTDEFGFSALPVGWYLKAIGGGFVQKDSAVVFWSVTDNPSGADHSTRDFRFDYSRRDVYLVPSGKTIIANSVRCLKD